MGLVGVSQAAEGMGHGLCREPGRQASVPHLMRLGLVGLVIVLEIRNWVSVWKKQFVSNSCISCGFNCICKIRLVLSCSVLQCG